MHFNETTNAQNVSKSIPRPANYPPSPTPTYTFGNYLLFLFSAPFQTYLG